MTNFSSFSGKCGIVLALILAPASSRATTHVIQFGGNLGYVYLPSSFTAVVGDSVEWEGDFSVHPLSSTTIPATATSWHNGSGSAFTYAIKVQGTYNYQCDVHFSIGMVGSFVANASSVRVEPLSDASLPSHVAFLNMTTLGKPTLSFFVPTTQFVTLEIFDVLGHKIETLVNQLQTPGTHSVALTAGIATQACISRRLTGNGFTAIRML